jgi:hypothetical protein
MLLLLLLSYPILLPSCNPDGIITQKKPGGVQQRHMSDEYL